MPVKKKIEEYQKSASPFKGSRSKKVAEKVAEETTIAASHKRSRSKKVAEKVAYQDSTMSHEIKTDKNMSEDMNMIRFEMLIDEVGKKLHIDWAENDGFDFDMDEGYILLDYFFDPQKMNSYAKMIYDKARNCIYYFPKSENETISWNSQVELFSPFDIKNNIRSKIRAMKTFCKCYNFYENYEKLYALLFWSFMILTVDDNQKEEALAKISDFLTLLGGEREDMKSYFDPKNTPLYIISVIKYLYHDDDYEDVYDGTSTASIVSRFMNMGTDSKIETYFKAKGVIKKRGDTSATSDTWTCPNCGKIMPKYVGTCGCGEPKPFEF